MKKKEHAIRYASNSFKQTFEAHSELLHFLHEQWSEIFALQEQIDDITDTLRKHTFQLAAPLAE